MTVSEQAVRQVLETVRTPYLDVPIGEFVDYLSVDQQRVNIDIVLGFACKGLVSDIQNEIRIAVAGLDSSVKVSVKVGWQIGSHVGPGEQASDKLALPEVKHVLAVASGKGGVGKSTIAVNLALGLHREGAQVGLLDADIYGPSQGIMLGVPEGTRPKIEDESSMVPIRAHGIQCMSMSFVAAASTPVVWRGPMASGALQQLIGQTKWQDVDYLVVDMPPGTGDIQLTLTQRVPLSGVVIVTTPQDIALIDARKGIEMFNKVDVPLIGIVENMSWHVCDSCGHKEYLFGEGGGASLAEKYATDVIGSIPLSLSMREGSDAGNPVVVGEPDSELANRFLEMARAVGAALCKTSTAPVISIVDD